MPLTQLIRLVDQGKYAEDLGGLRLEELFASERTPLWLTPHEGIEDAVLRIFEAFGERWLSSGFFVRYLGLERWTAQKICGELAQRGQLERRGRTAGTRYRFVGSS